MIFVPNRKYAPVLLLISAVMLAIGMVVGFLLKVSMENRQVQNQAITSFEECAEAGYPIMESYPEQCMTPDGRSFTREVSSEPTPIAPDDEEQVFCTMDAMQCPDGSFVGRIPPSCEFAPCTSM